MLQWMGGSRRKVTTSRKSTQKRQKQYFEQRKRQQQNLHTMRSEVCSDDVLGTTRQYIKESRSLDILNLVNLSSDAQKCNSASHKGSGDVKAGVSTVLGNVSTTSPTTFTSTVSPTDSCELEEARAPLGGCPIQTSWKKAFVSSPSNLNRASSGLQCKPSHQKTKIERKSELSIIDLLYDDEPNITAEEYPTCEDHVAFSLEGLGYVGTETPFHSPQQSTRIECCLSPSLKDRGKMKLSRNFNHVLEDLELEVDTMMQDIDVAPVSSFSNFTYNKVKKCSATAGDCKHYTDHINKGGSSLISQEFFNNTENSNANLWDASFLDEKNDDEMRYDTSWKKNTFQTGTSSPDFLKDEVYNMASYGSLFPRKRSSATAIEGLNMIESPASYFKDQSESDFRFFVPSEGRHSRSDGNFNVQNLILEDVRDNSSLLSEESCSSTAVRGDTIRHSPSRLGTGENRRKESNGFASPVNKCRFKQGKCRIVSNPSDQKPSYYSNFSLQENLGAQSNWQLEERYASVDTDSGAVFRKNLETKFGSSGTKERTEDPFGVLTTPELHKSASPLIGGLKNCAPVANSTPCCFTSEKSAFANSPEFSHDGSWPIRSNLSPKFQVEGNPEDVGDFHCETASPNTLLQESVNKHEEIKVNLQQESCRNLELGEELSERDNGITPEKMERDTTLSNSHTQECEGTGDTTTKIINSLETIFSPDNGEEISSSLKKSDKHESKAVPIKKNCDAERPLNCKISNEDTQNWQAEERNRVAGKHNTEHINSSGQVMMFKSYVFQLFCVQKVLK